MELAKLQLDVIDYWPDDLRDVPAVLIQQVLPNPTLIHLPGDDPRPLFVSVLLHGDEDVGLKAIQRVVANHLHSNLPRALSVFVGNVFAATHGVRTLPGQLDFNRVWAGSELGRGSEHDLMQEVFLAMIQKQVAASIDLHNNSGRNPYYACLCALDSSHIQLAGLFSDKALYFQRPKGVQTQAFMAHCPSITCECGPIGDQGGITAGAEAIERVFALGSGDLRALLPPVPAHFELFHTVATWRVRSHATLSFDSRSQCDVWLRPDLDRFNFVPLVKGADLGQLSSPLAECLSVTDQAAEDVTSQYFMTEPDGTLRLAQDVIPSMLTTSLDAIRLDCVGYFMERLSTSG